MGGRNIPGSATRGRGRNVPRVATHAHSGAGPGGVAPLERPAVATQVVPPLAELLRRVAATTQAKPLIRTVVNRGTGGTGAGQTGHRTGGPGAG